MARRKLSDDVDPYAEIAAYYLDRFARPADPPWKDLPWEPVRIGPTWQQDSDHWRMPERSLGLKVLCFCGRWLKHETGEGKPWRFTDEQARFIMWWYAVDADGRFTYRDGVLQRLKGWGKDPVGACLMFAEAFGPCRFDGWDGVRPVARDVPNAWVQTAAVSLEQTKNTMRLFPAIITDEAVQRFRIQIGKERIYGLGGSRLIQAVTSAPKTLEEIGRAHV